MSGINAKRAMPENFVAAGRMKELIYVNIAKFSSNEEASILDQRAKMIVIGNKS